MMGLDDYLLLFQKAVLEEINNRRSLDQQSYARLMEPMFELYIHYMCQNSTKVGASLFSCAIQCGCLQSELISLT